MYVPTAAQNHQPIEVQNRITKIGDISSDQKFFIPDKIFRVSILNSIRKSLADSQFCQTLGICFM